MSTQTGTEYVRPLIEEVFNEIERLWKEKVPEEELKMVKSYLSGELTRIFDGQYSV
mgnify:CR=1 FL=1